MASGDDTERTVVKTYVPSYQKAVWREHADAVEMSQSEFVRAMVQAGRRDFGGEEPDPSGSDPGGDALETRIEDVLADEPYLGWESLRDRLLEDFESRLEETLQDMQARNRVEHSGRNGGYALVADE
jgi:hypothetical protein